MPIYEYGCEECGHQFELLRPIGAPVPADCPDCGQDQVRKLVSATSFVLKGSGWYKDHYGLKPASAGSNSSGSSSSKSDSSSSSASSSSTDSSSSSAAKAAK